MPEKPKYIFIAHIWLEVNNGYGTDLLNSEMDISELYDNQSLAIAFMDVLELHDDGYSSQIVIYEDGIEVYNTDYCTSGPDYILDAKQKAELELVEKQRLRVAQWHREKEERDLKEKKDRLERLKNEVEQLEKEVNWPNIHKENYLKEHQ